MSAKPGYAQLAPYQYQRFDTKFMQRAKIPVYERPEKVEIAVGATDSDIVGEEQNLESTDDNAIELVNVSESAEISTTAVETSSDALEEAPALVSTEEVSSSLDALPEADTTDSNAISPGPADDEMPLEAGDGIEAKDQPIDSAVEESCIPPPAPEAPSSPPQNELAAGTSITEEHPAPTLNDHIPNVTDDAQDLDESEQCQEKPVVDQLAGNSVEDQAAPEESKTRRVSFDQSATEPVTKTKVGKGKKTNKLIAKAKSKTPGFSTDEPEKVEKPKEKPKGKPKEKSKPAIKAKKGTKNDKKKAAEDPVPITTHVENVEVVPVEPTSDDVEIAPATMIVADCLVESTQINATGNAINATEQSTTEPVSDSTSIAEIQSSDQSQPLVDSGMNPAEDVIKSAVENGEFPADTTERIVQRDPASALEPASERQSLAPDSNDDLPAESDVVFCPKDNSVEIIGSEAAKECTMPGTFVETLAPGDETACKDKLEAQNDEQTKDESHIERNDAELSATETATEPSSSAANVPASDASPNITESQTLETVQSGSIDSTTEEPAAIHEQQTDDTTLIETTPHAPAIAETVVQESDNVDISTAPPDDPESAKSVPGTALSKDGTALPTPPLEDDKPAGSASETIPTVDGNKPADAVSVIVPPIDDSEPPVPLLEEPKPIETVSEAALSIDDTTLPTLPPFDPKSSEAFLVKDTHQQILPSHESKLPILLPNEPVHSSPVDDSNHSISHLDGAEQTVSSSDDSRVQITLPDDSAISQSVLEPDQPHGDESINETAPVTTDETPEDVLPTCDSDAKIIIESFETSEPVSQTDVIDSNGTVLDQEFELVPVTTSIEAANNTITNQERDGAADDAPEIDPPIDPPLVDLPSMDAPVIDALDVDAGLKGALPDDGSISAVYDDSGGSKTQNVDSALIPVQDATLITDLVVFDDRRGTTLSQESDNTYPEHEAVAELDSKHGERRRRRHRRLSETHREWEMDASKSLNHREDHDIQRSQDYREGQKLGLSLGGSDERRKRTARHHSEHDTVDYGNPQPRDQVRELRLERGESSRSDRPAKERGKARRASNDLSLGAIAKALRPKLFDGIKAESETITAAQKPKHSNRPEIPRAQTDQKSAGKGTTRTRTLEVVERELADARRRERAVRDANAEAERRRARREARKAEQENGRDMNVDRSRKSRRQESKKNELESKTSHTTPEPIEINLNRSSSSRAEYIEDFENAISTSPRSHRHSKRTARASSQSSNKEQDRDLQRSRRRSSNHGGESHQSKRTEVKSSKENAKSIDSGKGGPGLFKRLFGS